MLTPAKVEKFTLVTLKDYEEPILRELGELGIAHIEFKETEQQPHLQDKLAEILDLLKKVEDTLSVLGISEKKRSLFGMIDLPVEVEEKVGVTKETLDKIEKEVENIYINIYKRVNELAKRREHLIKEIKELEERLILAKFLRENKLESKYFGEGRYTTLICGFVTEENLDVLKKVEKLGAKCIYKLADEKIPCIVFYPNDIKDDVIKTLKIANFREESPQDIEEGILSKKREELKEIDKEISELKRREERRLLALREILSIEKEILEARIGLKKTKKCCVIQGWILPDKKALLERKVRGIAGKFCYITYSHEKDAPTLLTNSKLTKPFDMLTKLYGVPLSHEINPSIFMLFTFPVIFGAMFGDVALGIALAILGLVLIKKFKGIEILRDFSIIVITCGVASTIFGFLYAEAFGVELEELGIHLHPILFSPSKDQETMLKFAIFIGVAHMGLGMLINIVNKLLEKEKIEAIFTALKLWIFVGGVYVVFSGFKTPIRYPLLISFVLLPLEPMIKERKIKAIGHGLIETLETVLKFLSNTISYGRIFALALVHAGLCLAVLMIADMMPNILLKYLVIIFGGFVVLVMESLMVFLHTLRLHLYEWFTKFYSGEGKEFKPFKFERMYTELTSSPP